MALSDQSVTKRELINCLRLPAARAHCDRMPHDLEGSTHCVGGGQCDHLLIQRPVQASVTQRLCGVQRLCGAQRLSASEL